MSPGTQTNNIDSILTENRVFECSDEFRSKAHIRGMGTGTFVSQHAFVKEPRHSVSLKFPGQAKDHVILVPAARYAEMQLLEAIRLGYDAEKGRRELQESLVAFQQWHE